MLQTIQKLVSLEWPVRMLGPLIGKFNPFLSEYRDDPYPFYERLRSRHPVYFSPALRGWIVSRHADIVSVLQDPRFSVDRTQSNLFRVLKPLEGLQPELVDTITSSLLMVDPPRHTRLRRLVNKAFTPRVVEGLRPRVQRIVDELLDRVAGSRRMDLVRDLAYPLPVVVIAELLGLPAEDHAKLKDWSDVLTVLVDPFQGSGGMGPAERAANELSAYLRPIFAERRREPRQDLISALVSVEDEGQTLSEPELFSLTALILGAGHETTTNLIGNAVLALLGHPLERRRLEENPTLIVSAVEEFLRYDSPVQLTDRVATADLEFAGRRIRKGVIVAVLLGAGNRDPERFPDPDRLDLGRKENHHLAFGHGAHFCVGAALARVEAQIAISTLLRRFPGFDGDHRRPERKRSMVLRGPTALPLRW
jgi:cytochrome P450